jgi:(2R)-sulfolactate sulfo-lyase subunit alpha
MREDRTVSVKVLNDIPIGHKVALRDIAASEGVVKYGVDIGKVVAPITRGEHVHVHNLKTRRW